MPRPPPPRGLLLDLGNTILRELPGGRPAGHRAVFALAADNPRGVTAEEWTERGERLSGEIEPRRQRSFVEFGLDRLIRLLAETTGVRFERPDTELQLAFWRAAGPMEPEPEIEAALAEIRRRELPVGVVSNTQCSASVLESELERFGLAQSVDFVMASRDYGFRKPHRALFEAAASRIGLPPHDLWFVGDHPEYDVAGARAAGMTGVWYNPHRAPNDDVDADLELRSWGELGALLD